MTSRIVIVGAGAAGLMAARELSRSGKKVLILEARDRIGGRIFPLDEKEFGYPAQGGAEFVHGPALVTKALAKEAGLIYEPMPADGEMMTVIDGKLEAASGNPLENEQLAAHRLELNQKLKQLKEDLPIAKFLDKNFADEKYSGMKNWIYRMVEGFDAGDLQQISTFSLRDEWLGQDEWEQGRIVEGYGKVLEYLQSECRKNGVQIILNQQVEQVEQTADGVRVQTQIEETYETGKIIITVPVPLVSHIKFVPELPEKIAAAENIGFGQAIKIVLRFSEKFWPVRMSFLFSEEQIGTWWTQYPKPDPILVGWLAGPKALGYKDKSNEELLEIAQQSLEKIFKDEVRNKLVAYKVNNWPIDKFAQGAYSYSKPESKKAYRQLRTPVANKIYFAGEAVCQEKETATVEGALASGLDVANKIIKGE